MSIREKLARLDKSGQIDNKKQPDREENPQWIEDFQRELDARVLTEKNSFVILKENYYPLYDIKETNKIGNDDLYFENFHHITAEFTTQNLNLRKTLFIDLETTGLSGGTGTFAFLIGLGHVELDQIVVRQYLLPDFQYEWLMLKFIENNLENFENLVSFNGKSFDIPLLRNRFVLNRMETILDELPHIDILHASRRLWKRRLKTCDLQNLEYVILGQERLHDVPGEMVPQIYFEYIRKRRAEILGGVLEHNYHDIVNMVLLTIHIGQILNHPLTMLNNDLDILSLANYLYQKKFYEDAKPLFEYMNENLQDSELKIESMYHLSMLLKKSGEVNESGKIFQNMLKLERNHPEAIIELAKYYEHKEKNYTGALELIEHSLSNIRLFQQLERENRLSTLKEDLLHRRKRILSKITKLDE